MCDTIFGMPFMEREPVVHGIYMITELLLAENFTNHLDLHLSRGSRTSMIGARLELNELADYSYVVGKQEWCTMTITWRKCPDLFPADSGQPIL